MEIKYSHVGTYIEYWLWNGIACMFLWGGGAGVQGRGGVVVVCLLLLSFFVCFAFSLSNISLFHVLFQFLCILQLNSRKHWTFFSFKMIFRQRIRDNFTAPPTACINKMVMGRLPWGGGSASPTAYINKMVMGRLPWGGGSASPTACINKMVAGERDGEWGKQVGSMNEESQVSGYCNITFNYTNQETV